MLREFLAPKRYNGHEKQNSKAYDVCHVLISFDVAVIKEELELPCSSISCFG